MTNQELAAAAYQQNRMVDNYTYMKSLSTGDRAVYQHRRTKKVVIAFRGTDPTNWRDLTTDALMTTGLGAYGSRFKNARKITAEVIQRYGKENVSVTGHSLGGSQALHVSRHFGVKAEVFNPFVHPSETILALGLTRPSYKHATIHSNLTDPVSTLAPLAPGAKHHVHYQGLFAHSLKAKPTNTGRGAIAVEA